MYLIAQSVLKFSRTFNRLIHTDLRVGTVIGNIDDNRHHRTLRLPSLVVSLGTPLYPMLNFIFENFETVFLSFPRGIQDSIDPNHL